MTDAQLQPCKHSLDYRNCAECETPETAGSPRSLIAQWRKEAWSIAAKNYDRTSAYHARAECAAELEKALNLQDAERADLDAEMRRFAELHVNTMFVYSDGRKVYTATGERALAWAERLKGLRSVLL